MQTESHHRLFPEPGPGRAQDTILSILLSLCASILISNEEIFQTDVLYISSVVEDLYNGTGLSGWSFSPAPYFFPDILTYSLLYPITGSHTFTLRAYGIIQAALLVFLLLRLFSPPGKRYGIFRILFVVQFLLLVHLQDFYAFLFLPGMHCSAFLMALALFHRIRKETLKPHGAIYIVILTLTALSDRIFIVYALLPALISLFFALRLRKRNPDYGKRVPGDRIRYWLKVLLPSILIALVGFPVMKALLSMGRPASISPVQSLLALAGDLYSGFHAPYLFYFQCVVLLIFTALLMQRVLLATEKEIKREDRPSWIFYGRISSSNLLFFLWLPPLAAVLSGAYVDAYSIRYFAGSFIVANAAMLSVACNIRNRPGAHLSRFVGPLRIMVRKAGAIALAATLLPLLIYWHYESSGDAARKVIWEPYYPVHVRCLDTINLQLSSRARKTDSRWAGLPNGRLSHVMADYWHAKPIYLFSRTRIVSYHADYATGRPSRTIANMNWWKNAWPPQAVYMQNLPEELIRGVLGPPAAIIDCSILLEQRSAHTSRTENTRSNDAKKGSEDPKSRGEPETGIEQKSDQNAANLAPVWIYSGAPSTTR